MSLKFYGIPLVWIRIANRLTDEDGALRKAFYTWQMANDVYPVVNGSASPDQSSAGYAPADARKVIAWLKEHGGEVDPSVGLS